VFHLAKLGGKPSRSLQIHRCFGSTILWLYTSLLVLRGLTKNDLNLAKMILPNKILFSSNLADNQDYGQSIGLDSHALYTENFDNSVTRYLEETAIGSNR